MPGKGGGKKLANAKSKKAENKKKDKIIEDKTFGLKNKKKSKAVQKYVQAVEAQVRHGNVPRRAAEDAAPKAKKALLEQKKRELALLFASVDGDKPVTKTRAQQQADKEAENERQNAARAEEDRWNALSQEEQIEERRAKLDRAAGTKVTAASFAKWLDRRRKRKLKEQEKAAKDEAKRTGKRQGLSGRALYERNQGIFVDDDGAAEAHDTANREVWEEDESAPAGGGGGGGGDDEGEDDAAAGAGESVAKLAEVVDKSLFVGGAGADDLDEDDLDDLDDDDE